MPTVFVRILLFLSSYFPLSLICICLFWKSHPNFAVFALVIGLLGMAGMFAFLLYAQRIGGVSMQVASITRLDSESLNYIVAYVIPFLAIPYAQDSQGIALLIFFAVLAILFVKSNMLHINPMLNLVGYHLYRVTNEEGIDFPLITRRRIIRGERLSVVKLGDEILLEKTPT